ncbi:MAG: porin family protein [Hyphomonadaceae bacterium]|nr:porin family protein [Hyphomonadaceae bacterium]
MKLKLTPLALASAAAIMSGAASAQTAVPSKPTFQPKSYFDAGANFVMFDGDALSNPDGEYNAMALQGRYGYKFTSIFSVEMDIAVGVSDAEADDNVFLTTDTISIGTLAGLYGRAGFNPTDQLHLFAKGGFVGGDIEIDIVDQFTGQSLAQGEGGVNGFGVGLGFEVNATDTVFLRGDYTRYDTESDGGFELKADTYALAVGIRF